LVTIGKLSYGIYLIHLLALNVADKLVKPGSGSFLKAAAAYVVASALSIAVAYALNVAIERPGIAIGKRLSSLLKRRRDERVERTVALVAVQVPEFTDQGKA
jgi:peptidoglycan/LPS O-acetylase OafA/YrhL